MRYEEVAAYIESVPSFTKKNTLDNTRRLLSLLGDPQEKMQIIHVAGTNGKGSVCAFTEQALRAGGIRTGLFTSPHLVTIRERFVIDGEQISEDDFVEVFDAVMDAVHRLEAEGGKHPAYFELLLAMGMCWYARRGVEVLVMETGLGGLRDATNVVEHPALTIITSISLDHTEYLGNTVEEIAAHKAGIIKKGVPVVYDASCQEAARVIANQAGQMDALAVPVYPGMSEVTERTDKSIAFVLNNQYYDYKEVTLSFVADYQVMNASLAMTALRVWDRNFRLSDQQIVDAVAKTHWKGRMEMLAPGIVVDGAHNEDGIRQCLRTVKRMRAHGPVALLFAAVVEKNYEKMIQEICEAADYAYIVVTQIEGHRKVEAEQFASLFARYTSAQIYAIDTIDEALRCAVEKKTEETTLLCVGSLYLVGEVEKALKGESHD